MAARLQRMAATTALTIRWRPTVTMQERTPLS